MPICSLPTVDIHYSILTSDTRETNTTFKPKLVLLHGLLLGNLASWYLSVAPYLSQKYDVLMYDLRGHGKSSCPKVGYRVEDGVDDLQGLLSHLGWWGESIAIAGHSYGGLIALKFSMMYSQWVRCLALIDTPLPPSQLEELNHFQSFDAQEILKALPTELATLLSQGGRRSRKSLERWSLLLLETTLMKALREEDDLTDDQLSKIDCPVLAIYGSRSSCLPTLERLCRFVPDCEHYILQDTGHYILNERPQSVRDHLSEFLNQSLYGHL